MAKKFQSQHFLKFSGKNMTDFLKSLKYGKSVGATQ